MAKTKHDNAYGLGRRKEATARARIVSGKGNIVVNDLPIDDYFNNPNWTSRINDPIKLIGREGKFDISLLVRGGGKSGQVDACRLAISNALVDLNEDLRPTLKKAGFLKRDDRIKERKKYGLKRARKAPQFTKR